MSNRSDTARRRLAALFKALELGDVEAACRESGMSRSNFYRLLKEFNERGVSALFPKKKPKPKMPNAFGEEVVALVLGMTLHYPSYSYNRISQKMAAHGIKISGTAIRKIWERRGISTTRARHLWLEEEAKKGKAELNSRLEKAIQKYKA